MYNTNSPTKTIYTYTFEADTAVVQSYMTRQLNDTILHTYMYNTDSATNTIYTYTFEADTDVVQCLSVRAWL